MALAGIAIVLAEVKCRVSGAKGVGVGVAVRHPWTPWADSCCICTLPARHLRLRFSDSPRPLGGSAHAVQRHMLVVPPQSAHRVDIAPSADATEAKAGKC